MIKQIIHAAFTVKDMEKSLHFYCDVLGFKKMFVLNGDNGKPRIVYLKVVDGQFIELFYGGDRKVEIDRTTIGYSHLSLEVDDIFEIADRLRNAGLTIDKGPVQGIDLNYQCWVKDPDGNRIEFMKMDPESPQMKG